MSTRTLEEYFLTSRVPGRATLPRDVNRADRRQTRQRLSNYVDVYNMGDDISFHTNIRGELVQRWSDENLTIKDKNRPNKVDRHYAGYSLVRIKKWFQSRVGSPIDDVHSEFTRRFVRNCTFGNQITMLMPYLLEEWGGAFKIYSAPIFTIDNYGLLQEIKRKRSSFAVPSVNPKGPQVEQIRKTLAKIANERRLLIVGKKLYWEEPVTKSKRTWVVVTKEELRRLNWSRTDTYALAKAIEDGGFAAMYSGPPESNSAQKYRQGPALTKKELAVIQSIPRKYLKVLIWDLVPSRAVYKHRVMNDMLVPKKDIIKELVEALG